MDAKILEFPSYASEFWQCFLAKSPANLKKYIYIYVYAPPTEIVIQVRAGARARDFRKIP